MPAESRRPRPSFVAIESPPWMNHRPPRGGPVRFPNCKRGATHPSSVANSTVSTVSRSPVRRIALAAVLLAACRAASVNPAPASATPSAAGAGAAPRGALVILGGGPRPDDVMSRFVALAGGPGRAEIVVLPMASGEGAEAGEQQAERFRRMGARARSMQLVRADADADSTAEILSRATGV